MLPKAEDSPTGLDEEFGRIVISRDIAPHLCGPIVGMGLSSRVVLGAAMPEATIYEDSEFHARKRNVSRPSYLGQWSTIDEVAKPASVQFST